MNQTNSIKKAKQTEDKRVATEDLGTLQKNNSFPISKHLLYLWSKEFGWKQLAHWSFVGEGLAWCLYEVRPTGIKAPVLQMQHSPWRSGGRLQRQDGTRNWGRSDGTTSKG